MSNTYNRRPINVNFMKVRYKLGVSQDTCGKALYISRHVTQAYESGRCQPNLATIKELFKMANIPKEELYDFIFDFNYVIPK